MAWKVGSEKNSVLSFKKIKYTYMYSVKLWMLSMDIIIESYSWLGKFHLCAFSKHCTKGKKPFILLLCHRKDSLLKSKYRNVSAMCVANEMLYPAINSTSRYAVHRLNTNGPGQKGTKCNGSNDRRVQLLMGTMVQRKWVYIFRHIIWITSTVDEY